METHGALKNLESNLKGGETGGYPHFGVLQGPFYFPLTVTLGKN